MKDSQDLLRGHTARRIGSHEFIRLDTGEFDQIPPIPTNRDSLARLRTMKQTFEKAYAQKQEQTLTEIALGIVKESFTDPESGTEYPRGAWYVVDGNTRQHFWRQNPEYAQRLTRGLTAKIHWLQSMTDVEYAYYPYNNRKSVENSSQILQGLRNRYRWQPRQQMFQNGGYKSALDWASMVPGEDRQDIFENFHNFFDSLKILDSIPQNSEYGITKPALGALRCQAIIAATLLAVQHNPSNLRLMEFVQRLSTITHDDLDRALQRGELDAVEIVALEYSGQSHRRTQNRDAAPWLHYQAKSTKFSTRIPQMDFVMHWIQVYISGPQIRYKPQGIKQNMWQGAWQQTFPDYQE